MKVNSVIPKWEKNKETSGLHKKCAILSTLNV